MTRMRHLSRFAGVAALVAVMVSCGDVVRQDRTAVLLTVQSLTGAPGDQPSTLGTTLLSDVVTLVTSGGAGTCSTQTPCATIFNDVGQAILTAPLKDVTTSSSLGGPTTNNDV